jgi:hypothetical protein
VLYGVEMIQPSYEGHKARLQDRARDARGRLSVPRTRRAGRTRAAVVARVAAQR